MALDEWPMWPRQSFEDLGRAAVQVQIDNAAHCIVEDEALVRRAAFCRGLDSKSD